MSTLYLPINIQALVLTEPLEVPGPMVDFSRLPGYDGTTFRNPDTPWLGSSVETPPGQTMTLGAGAHLHWRLPAALTQILQHPDGTVTYPNVPDQWVVMKIRPYPHPVEHFLVESAYRHPTPADGGAIPNAITMPDFEGSAVPYFHMGRSVNLFTWNPNGNRYEAPLTAFGYGEPTFAAFYPNCHSVFGFHDPDATPDTLRDTTYRIIGLYRDPSADALGMFVREYLQKQPNAPAEEINAAIEEAFNWLIPEGTASAPSNTLLYGEIIFSQEATIGGHPAALDPRVTSMVHLSLANSGTEAVAAYTAWHLSVHPRPDHDLQVRYESQLEAIQHLDMLNARTIDIGDKFVEARHTETFHAQSAGSLWTVEKMGAGNAVADAEAVHAAASMMLPDGLGDQLTQLNILQAAWNSNVAAIQQQQMQLFADWSKYVTAASAAGAGLPDPNPIRVLIEGQSIPALNALIRETGEQTIPLEADGIVRQPASSSSVSTSLAFRLAYMLNTVRAGVEEANRAQPGANYALRATEAPRYWMPNDPAIALTGEIARPTTPYPGNHPIQGYVFADTDVLVYGYKDGVQGYGVSHTVLNDLNTLWTLGLTTWIQPPWNPLLLDWRVNVLPLANAPATAAEVYPPDFITRNFSLSSSSPDLVPLDGQQMASASFPVEGRSMLTASAMDVVYERIYQGVYREVMPGYFATYPDIEDPDKTYLKKNLAAVQSWYEATFFTVTTTEDQKNSDPDYTMIRSLGVLGRGNILAQSLSGFTHALVQMRPGLQFPAADPTAASNARSLAVQVNSLISGAPQLSLLLQNRFSPLRNGWLQLDSLTVTDSFGQRAVLPVAPVISADSMPQTQRWIALQPRLAHPARLLFRWLSADGTTEEMNSAPDSQPICGWLVPNHLDASLEVYHADGASLGEIVLTSTDVRWEPAPDSDAAVYSLDTIENTYLRNVVTHLLGLGRDDFSSFMDAFEAAQDRINPENANQFPNRVYLVGQPVAVVRTTLQLDWMGGPPVDQRWEALTTDMSRFGSRTNAGIPDLTIPVRLGQYNQMDDGLIGYWVENQGAIDGAFFSATADPVPVLPLSLASRPVVLTMLMDVRAWVHATTGLLPVKAINIPPAQYVAALSRIEFSFLSAPLLMHTNATEIPLPPEPGYTWSWVHRRRNEWIITDQDQILSPRADAVFSGPQRAVEGWLKLTRKEDDSVDNEIVES